MSGIYIHIPFCKQACTYCDFYFETSQKHRADFVERLLGEITQRAAADPQYAKEPVDTIYFGGGTPSRLSAEETGRVMRFVLETFSVAKDAEVTLEMNPDDVTPDYLDQLLDAGVNRISMGVQTFNVKRLQFMNRAHSREEALRALELLQKSGAKSWTADLIYGNPGQTQDDLMRDIEQLLEFDPPHVSAYSLTVEPNTRLGSLVRKSIVKPREDDEVSEHMEIVAGMLAGAGIQQYEVSNFARPGHESRHNSAYWTHTNYLGFGPSAHSFWWDAGLRGAVRWRNEPKLASYMKAFSSGGNAGGMHLFEPEFLDLEMLAEERLLIGLRTSTGVSLAELEKRYGYKLSDKQKSWIREMHTEGYMPDESASQDRIRLSSRGLHLADYLALQLISRQ